MSGQRLLLLDVDGTLADCASRIIEVLNARFGDEFRRPRRGRLLRISDITDIEMPFLRPHQHAYLMERLGDPDFYAGLAPEPGALETLPRLRRGVDRVVVATGRPEAARAVTEGWLGDMDVHADEVLVGRHVKSRVLSEAVRAGSTVLLVDDDPFNWMWNGPAITVRIPPHPWTVNRPGLRHLLFASWDALAAEVAAERRPGLGARGSVDHSRRAPARGGIRL